jgi:Golgi nucleoside diphosphatase
MLALLASLVHSALKYGIFVDAGSSGTRFNLYPWEATSDFPRIVAVPGSSAIPTLATRLADASGNASVVPSIFSAMIDACSRVLPAPDLPSTRAFVYATAGMRLLPAADQERIMADVFYYLRKNSPFRVKRADVRVISGAEEGMFGWLSVNTLTGRFSAGPTTLFSEIGGASMQIAYEASSSNNQYSVTVNHKPYSIFAYSYLGYGADQALANASAAVEGTSHPCLSAGYSGKIAERDFNGTANWTECRALINTTLFRVPAFTGVSLPSMADFPDFYGISVYAYLLQDLNESNDTITLDRFENLSINFSRKSWAEINDTSAQTWLFQMAYVVTVLRDGFKLSDVNKQFHFPRKIGGMNVGYALGAVVAHIEDIVIEDQAKMAWSATAVVDAILFVLLIAVVVVYMRSGTQDGPMGLLWVSVNS